MMTSKLPAPFRTNEILRKASAYFAQAELDRRAAANAVAEASKTVREIKSIYIKEMEATVLDGRIAQYRINAKFSFQLEDS